MNEAVWLAPAKLNLFLHVLGRRDDGYHELQTVFQFIDYCDHLRFRLRDDNQVIRVAGAQNVAADDDLVIRAARSLQQASSTQQGAEISVEKRIPMGAGLGGGSSDAATTLVALNYLWNLNLDENTLAELGLELGADVPVFVRGRAAWAEGVGEKLQDVELRQPWYLVIKPDCSIATAEIFNAPELTRNTDTITIRAFLGGAGRNDCDPVARGRYPAVAESLDWLGQFAEARMTGTGSCIFAEFDGQERAQDVLVKLPPKWTGFVARGLNRSPLYSDWPATEF